MKKVNELVNVEFCEICDNYTPEIWIDEAGENGCQICFDAYGLEFQKGNKNEKITRNV